MDSLIKLLRTLREFRLLVGLVIIGTLGITLTNLAGPWIIRAVVGLVEGGLGQEWQTIVRLSILLLALYSLRALFAFATNYTAHWVAWSLVEKLRVRLYTHLQRLSLSYYQDKQTGQLMSRIVNDTQHLEPLLAHGVPDVIVNVLLLFGVAAILFSLNASLALWTLLPMPIIALTAYWFGRKARPAFRRAQERMAQLNGLLQDNIVGIKEIQIFTREHREEQRVEKRAHHYTLDLMYALKLNAIHHPAIEWLGSTGTVIVIFYGGALALRQALPVADIVAFLLYLGMFYQPIVVLARLNEGIQQALASADRIFEVLETEPDITEKPGAVDMQGVQGSVTFEHVDFSYIDGVPVLRDISLRVNPGETLALVGPTGVGKTTIISLIPRFYDTDSGRILIDNHDIKDVSFQSLRKHISVVLQDVFLFNGTVRDNLLYGNPHASDVDIERAAQLANAHEFIVELEDGYDTAIGERGVKLSGGQKQRLSIARAILKDAPILILDEATSSVDTETEHLIQEAFQTLMQDKTSIVVAHRLSTIKDADKIAVLEEGRIVQFGTHEQLMQEDGLYQRLYARQFKDTDAA